MRGGVPGIHPVIGHLLRAIEQIREDAASAIGDLRPEQIWAKPHGLTSAGFHLKHLAGSTERLSTYLSGGQLTADQLTAIGTEGEGRETAELLLAAVDESIKHYEALVRNLDPADFGAIREVGRKRYQVTAISLALHVAEHAQRHIGGLIAACNLARFGAPTRPDS